MSGEAFSAFRNPGAIGNNGSVPGLIFKLKLWGVPHMGFEAMRIVGWIYTLVVVAGAAWLATRVRPNGREPVIWLAILVLATMRSPFMATYAFFPVMWLADAGRAGRLERAARDLADRAVLVRARARFRARQHSAAVERGLDHRPDGAHVRPAGIRAPAAAPGRRARRSPVRAHRGPACMTRSITRVCFAATAGIVAGVALVTAAAGCGAPLALAIGLALPGAVAAGWLAVRSQAVGEVAALPTPVLGLGAAGMAVALVELARLAVPS